MGEQFCCHWLRYADFCLGRGLFFLFKIQKILNNKKRKEKHNEHHNKSPVDRADSISINNWIAVRRYYVLPNLLRFRTWPHGIGCLYLHRALIRHINTSHRRMQKKQKAEENQIGFIRIAWRRGEEKKPARRKFICSSPRYITLA